MRTLLVTGGTGAIGAEVVQRLVAANASERITVLTRAPSDPRRSMLLERWRAAGPTPVSFLAGSLQTLGAADTARGDVTHIMHLAADTRFSAPLEESRAVNAQGTADLLRFARQCPRLEAIGIASTVYVAGLRKGRILESELEHREGFANAYESSKHEMEELARHAMPELPISVCRLSTAIGQRGTGEVRSLNAFHTTLRLLYSGLVPMIAGSEDTPIDVISTDFAADALQHLLINDFRAGATYHVCAGRNAPTLGAILDTAMATMRARRPAWRKRAIEHPVLADERTYELFVRSVRETGDPIMAAATRAVESFARQLTRPKTFDTRTADAILSGAPARSDETDLCQSVVRYCMDNEWKAAA